jgi:hypothetical protein
MKTACRRVFSRGEELESLSDELEGLRKGLGLRIFSFWHLDVGNQRIWEWIAQKPPRQKRRETSKGEAVAARAKGQR